MRGFYYNSGLLPIKLYYLNSTVEEAAVLARFVEQAFGESQGEHAAGLVGLLQGPAWFLEQLHPGHRTRARTYKPRARIKVRNIPRQDVPLFYIMKNCAEVGLRRSGGCLPQKEGLAHNLEIDLLIHLKRPFAAL